MKTSFSGYMAMMFSIILIVLIIRTIVETFVNDGNVGLVRTYDVDLGTVSLSTSLNNDVPGAGTGGEQVTAVTQATITAVSPAPQAIDTVVTQAAPAPNNELLTWCIEQLDFYLLRNEVGINPPCIPLLEFALYECQSGIAANTSPTCVSVFNGAGKIVRERGTP